MGKSFTIIYGRVYSDDSCDNVDVSRDIIASNDHNYASWFTNKKKEWGEKFFWEEDHKENPHETSILKLDCKKAKERLGWETKLNINEALEWTINWYKKFLENSNIKEYTKKQIEEFESR